MLKIVDLNRTEELSPRRMAAVIGALGDIKGESLDDYHADEGLDFHFSTKPAPVTMADLWNQAFGSIAPV